jgi:hypothetical protein
MSEENPYSGSESDSPDSESDTQATNEPIDMEDQEEEETSRKVNENKAEPDKSDEEVDQTVD